MDKIKLYMNIILKKLEDDEVNSWSDFLILIGLLIFGLLAIAGIAVVMIAMVILIYNYTGFIGIILLILSISIGCISGGVWLTLRDQQKN